ncbi:MAG: hypothetical protein H7Y38_02160 [Armatimonadetes bacterium]|nr:hypothetical protein [Armatimonadota bacterium]
MRKITTATSVLATLCVAALTCLAVPAARAQLVYDNGSFVGAVVGRNISNFATADDFFVDGSIEFNAIRFFAIDEETGLLPNFGGTLSWFIYNSSVGETPGAIPGASILASGTVSGSAITIADTGQAIAGLEVAQLDFNIPTQTLGSGNYWLRLKEGTLTSTNDFTTIAWAEKGGERTANGVRQDNDEVNPTTWTTSGNNDTSDMAFQLRGNVTVVPEAGTVALLLPALGVLGTVIAVCKRK